MLSPSQIWHDLGHEINQIKLALANKLSKIILGRLWNERRMLTRIEVSIPDIEDLKEKKVQLSVCTLVTEDTSDLQIWLQYHRKVGVEKFFIYSFINPKELIDEFSLEKDVVVVPWARFFKPNSQILSQAHAIANFGRSTEFMAFIDPDEYMVPTQDLDIKDVLRRFPESNGFVMHWKCFNDSGLEEWPSGANLLETLTNMVDLKEAELQMKREFTREKHIVRVQSVLRVGVHKCDIQGMNTTIDEFLVLNHYLFKSKMDLDLKIRIRENEAEPEFEFETWKRKRLEMHRFARENYVRDLRALEIWKNSAVTS